MSATRRRDGFDAGIAPMNAPPHRALWVEVVATAMRDLGCQPPGRLKGANERFPLSGENREARAAEARKWLGSRDFHHVCALAGLDGQAVLDRLGTQFRSCRGGRVRAKAREAA